MPHTLILNTDYTPRSVIPLSANTWQRAIEKVWKEKATPLAYYDEWVVRSPRESFRVPSVIVQRDWHKPKRHARFTPTNLFLRDGHRCQYCGQTGIKLTFDHVHPKSLGGKENFENIVAACQPCNAKKANHRHMKPFYEPYKPTYWELADKRKKLPIVVPHASWIDYLDWDPSLITISTRHR